jgi:HEAT repeat protein
MWEKLVNKFRGKDKPAPQTDWGLELLSLDEKTDIPSLLANLSGTNKQKQASAAEILGKFQREEALPNLVDLLSSSNLGVVLAVTEALKNYPPAQTLPLLLATLDDPLRWPPARVAEIIVSYGQGIVTVLADCFPSKTGEAQTALVEMLGRLGTREGLPIICMAMSTDQPTLRQKAAWAAGQLGVEIVSEPGINRLLQALLQDPVAMVRAQALETLWEKDASQAWPLVQAAMLDQDRIVRSRAAGMLSDRLDLPREIWSISGKKILSPEDRQNKTDCIRSATATK